jgi:hydrogenase maturation protease
VIGFGNPYRRDDGVGPAVVNALRSARGQPILGPLDDGLEELGGEVDSIVVHQLVPEFAQLLGPYDLAIFVDAHLGDGTEPLQEAPITPSLQMSSVSHLLHPGTLLELARRLHGRAPEGVLLSLKGSDFDFGDGLSPETARLVPRALLRIWALIEGRSGRSGNDSGTSR